MSLSRNDALAYTERYAEFQEDNVIIRVDFPPYGDRGEWLVRANKTYLYTWQDIDKIVAFARTHLRSMQLARWRLYDLAGLREKALIPYGIWINPSNDTAICEVSYNPFLRIPVGLAELTEDDVVLVERAATGWLTIAGARHSTDMPKPWKLPQHCPCCYCWTLEQRGAFFLCPVCRWEDDGQDDYDADAVTNGPNGDLSLTQARANYRAFGACRREEVPHARPPKPEELP